MQGCCRSDVRWAAPEYPQPAEYPGDSGYTEQYARQQSLIAKPAPMERNGVRAFIDQEANGRKEGKASSGVLQWHGMPAEGQVVVARKGNPHGDQPAKDIGEQWTQMKMLDQAHHGQPMHGGCHAANGNEAEWARNVMRHGGAMEAILKPHDATRLKLLCVCADDCGLDTGVNAAIMQLVEMRRVQATSVLVGAPAWRNVKAWLRQQPADLLDVGLHLDFTEFPLLRYAPMDLLGLMQCCWLGRLDAGQARSEIRAQLDAFEDSMGRRPAFVDGHRHVHQFPIIRDELLAELAIRYPTSRPWLRATRCRLQAAWVAGVEGAIKALLIEALGASAMAKAARKLGFQQSHALLGVYGFNGGIVRYATLLRGWLQQARNGDVLMCHPGYLTHGRDGLAQARDAEYQVLSSAAMSQWLDAEGVQLQALGEIFR